jgi:two-component system sensor histidine kinase FlrB
MDTVPTRSTESRTEPGLHRAFDGFSRASRELSDSYQALEERVTQLSSALADASSERDRKQAEKERLSERLRLLLEVLPGGVVVLDGHGRVGACNPAAVNLLGDSLPGRAWREVVDERFVPGPGAEVGLRDGRWVRIATRSLGSEPGQVLLITDVTQTRDLELQVRRMERLAELGNVVASLAHQIRTPLAAALLDGSTLRVAVDRLAPCGPEADAARRVQGRLIARLRHLERLVDDMLTFARQGRFQVEPVDLRALLDALVVNLEPEVVQAGGSLELANLVGATPVRGNAEALESALQSLVVNAIQMSGDAPRVRIAARSTPDGWIEIEVADEGPGVPPELGERIFEPFFTTRAQGTGLGLAIVRGIVEAHQGQVALASPTGAGAAFLVRIPRATIDNAELPAP